MIRESFTDPGARLGGMGVDRERWVFADGCAVCPRCNAFVPCENSVGAVLAVAEGHDCRVSPGTGLYVRPPGVAVAGWYWAEDDGSWTLLSGQGGLPA